jgi:hypothetical protein
MVRRQSARGAQRSCIRGFFCLAMSGLVALPTIAAAQSGKGFLFKKPNGSFVMRAGYEAANTSSQPFTVLKQQTTLGPRSFDAFSLGFDLNFFLNDHVDFVTTFDASTRTNTAEYREWEENGQPIVHQSTLDRAALGAGFRYNLLGRGRQISSLAFIPAKTVPYVGATGGMMWYDFTQKGDFVEVVNDSTGNIFTDELRSGHHNVMGQAFAGIERRLNARWSMVGETRYTQSSAKLVKDYSGLGDIQLSGLAFTLGATVRF